MEHTHLSREFLIPYLAVLSLFVIRVIYILWKKYHNYQLQKRCLSHEEAVGKIKAWYEGIDGWHLPSTDNVFVTGKLENNLYGEITYVGMKELSQRLNLTYKDVFYDLGCGMGKLVTYMYLTNPIKKSVGIEMIGQRYRVAELALQQLQFDKLLNPQREIKFIHNNIRNEDFSDATVIYMSSLCFPTDLMAELSQKFAKLKLGSRIISLVPLHPSKFLQFKKVEILEMSWISASRVYYYERV